MRTPTFAAILLILACSSLGSPEFESTGQGQAIADEIRSAASADIAWIPAAMLEEEGKGDLSTYLKFGTDEIAVVKLSGDQIRAALERSISLFPSPNPSFLQISGLEVSFSKSAPADSRIRTVLVDGAELNRKSTYEVAMPITIARGGLGYFTVWKKTDIVRSLENVTLETLLKGKSGFVRTARWKPVD